MLFNSLKFVGGSEDVAVSSCVLSFWISTQLQQGSVGMGTTVWPGVREVVLSSSRGPRGNQHGKHASGPQTHFQDIPGITIPWTDTAIPSRAQVRTDKAFYNLHAHFGIVFLIQHLEASKYSSFTRKCQPVPSLSSQVPVKTLPLKLQHHKQSEHQPLPSPLYFKSSLCCWSLENPLIFLQSSSSLATSSSWLTFIEALYYMQALL